jgi:transposase
MPTKKLPTEQLEKLLHQRKCSMLVPLARKLGYALISVRRFLKQIGYFRSYTDNGKWYTLRHTPEFSRDGFWQYKGIGFSKHGSLIATIDHLVGHSPAGLTASEVAQKLRHPCHTVLTRLHQAGKLDRVKVAGQFRYLSKEAKLNSQQRQQALLSQGADPSSSLSTQTAVWVLVEHIKNPALSFDKIASHLQQHRKLPCSAEHIERFFHEHGLKKTPEVSSSRP